MRKIKILVLIAIIGIVIISCKKDKKSESNEPICNTAFYSYFGTETNVDTTAFAQSNSTYYVDSLFAKFKIVIHPTNKHDSDCVITLTDQSLGQVAAWNWDFGDGAMSNSQSTIHNYLYEGTHQIKLVVFDVNGKTDSAFFNFSNTLNPRLFFPNIFTPNNDGMNDYFRPVGIKIETSSNYSLTVEDKDNNVLFQTNDYNQGFSSANIDFNKYHNGDIFYAEFSARTTTGKSISGCTPLEMRLSPGPCSNRVFGDMLDPRYGIFYSTNEICN